ncbi:nitroreductase family protein [Candidatus Micrarchaeota archaeon]|nr:nitroreductase family protein [Candidatus Micrarchaeota archaeon]
MEFYEVLEKRCSIRKFTEKSVEKEKISKILNAILSAPSAGNLQSYQVYIAISQEIKDGLMVAAMDQGSISSASVVLVFCANQDVAGLKYGERGEELYSTQDATIAAAYSQLAITNEGLSSVWIGAFDPLEVSRLINADSKQLPIAMIPFGYAAEEPRERRRRTDLFSEV